MEKKYFVHESSYIDNDVTIGEGTKIWYFCHIQANATIGKNCSIGQNVNVANDVVIGDGCKIQNNVSIYEGVTLGNNVFCGPSMVFTNDLNPRADIAIEKGGYYKTFVDDGASIGANSTIVCGNNIGMRAMVAAGAVVTRNVRRHELVAGIPAKNIGWVCQCGKVLDDSFMCPNCGRRYMMSEEGLYEKY